MMSDPLKLLYFSGIFEVDKLIEDKYQGEDVYVSVQTDENHLFLDIGDFQKKLFRYDISEVKLLYEDGLLSFVYHSSECIFSYEHKISFQLLSFINDFNSETGWPEFLKQRYQQMLDRDLFLTIDKEKESVPEHDHIHYYDDIDELQYRFIADSMAAPAISEAPLLYIKYDVEGEKEEGLLITYKKIYSPENSIAIDEVKTINLKEEFGSLNCYINDDLFSLIYLDVNRQLVEPFYYSGFSIEDVHFPTEHILNFIIKILNFLR